MERHAEMSTIAEDVCFKLAKRRVLSRQSGAAGFNAATFDSDGYQDWRKKELESQFTQNFSAEDIRGRDVVDFGCGGGELSFLAAELGATSVVGLEVSRDCYEIAVAASRRQSLPVAPVFRHSDDTRTIDLPDASCDVILCFDVLEHIMDYATIIPEWHRVLRPGGHVLIWWMPYYHPWGHHVESLVPVPWAHALFSDRTVIKTCARIYDMPEFTPRIWDLDAGGRKKPNKWHAMTALPTLNKLTIARFERLCRAHDFAFDRRELQPMRSSRLARAVSSMLIGVPGLREYFTSVAIYDLRK
jgi:SAM-dependent methyltransferase